MHKTNSTEQAVAMAQKLCREALWLDNRCTWVGLQASERQGRRVICARTLGPDLYGGATGVAYFLSDIFNLTGESLFRTTALAAIRYALAGYAGQSNVSDIGFYSGLAGISASAVICGQLCGDDVIVDQGLRLELEIEEFIQKNECATDVISGLSGLIFYFLILWRRLSVERYLTTATLCGHKLLESAKTENGTHSWIPSKSSPKPLTGFAHGAAGISASLMELFSVTQQEKFIEGAKKGFAFERLHFDSEANNWLDLRETSGLANGNRHFGISWCHGAPGVLLSRVRALAITNAEDYGTEIAAAKEATIEIAERELSRSFSDSCLCHGLAGLAMILDYAGRVLDDARCSQASKSILWTLSGRWHRYGFFCSHLSHFEDTPQLLLGLAGIGESFLQLEKRSAMTSVLHPGMSWT